MTSSDAETESEPIIIIILLLLMFQHGYVCIVHVCTLYIHIYTCIQCTLLFVVSLLNASMKQVLLYDWLAIHWVQNVASMHSPANLTRICDLASHTVAEVTKCRSKGSCSLYNDQIILSKFVQVFDDIRNRHFSSVAPYLSSKAKELQTGYDVSIYSIFATLFCTIN